MEGSGGDILPCDCLLLGGSAVVNEATLTGESVPQMKEAVGRDDASLAVNLDIEGVHKVNTLFGGTSIIQMSHSGPEQADRPSLAYPPDGGCPCYALRTGFSSSQGELVKMIELSSSAGSSQDPENMRDSVMMILLLMCFAIAASGYVLKQGMEQGDRTRYELLIHCILIITSVVPSDLPMQLALAVNASLMHLMKLQVFCTEPFRVPMSGRLDCCFFDKTGTITTDQLQAVGVVPSSSDSQEIVPTVDAPLKVAQVLAGCHTLLKVDGRMLGDPIETEAMTSIKWEYNHELRTAAPKEGRGNATYDLKQQVRIIHRYHFESKLQRMSTIAAVDSGECGKPEIWLLTKGSPEKIAELLAPGEKPSWYEDTYRSMALTGMRVIALAWRPMAKLQDGSKASSADEGTLGLQSRDWAERDLRFAGFISFKCLLRKDSPAVVRALQKSNHSVAMITGDNILTAIHVAGEVGITSTERSKVLTLALADEDDPMSTLSWVNADTGKFHSPLEPSACASLVQSGFALCSTGKTTQAAFEQCGPDVVEALRHIVVFARMTPDGKERVLARLKAAGHRTLMCGDGANDVGALKQADVGVALLGGFGSLNAAKGGEKDTKDITFGEEEPERKDLEGLTFMEKLKKNMAEAHENQQKMQREKQKKQLEFRQKRAKAVEEQKKQKEKLLKEVEEETRRLQEQGAGSMAAFQAMKTVYGKQRDEQRAKVRNQGGFFAMSAAAMAAAQEGSEDMEGELPVLKLGDASIAAPFTSKWPSIKSVYDIIRQGRCTLVTSIQNNQILCLTSLISSYSLSVMYNDGIKFSDYQLTLTGMCLTASHLSVSYAQPLKQISAARPLTSMFSPALFTSTMGQFAIHLGTMIYAVHCAKLRLPEDWKAPGMDKEFQPNLINTVVFLIETVQQVTVLMVNYKGRPFQPSFTENKALLHSLGICGIGTLVCAYEMIPKLNEWLGMVTLPDDQLRSTILVMLLIDIFGCLLWDRAMIALFAPKIFRASMEATSMQGMVQGAGKLVVSGGAIWLLVNDGGIVSMLIIYWLYRSGFF
jgi:cation-transporting ATPase 13A1